MKSSWFVYIIRSKDGSLYTGITNNIKRRFSEHQNQGNRCAKYLKGKAPLTLVYTQEVKTRQEALKIEIDIKNKSKVAKEKMIVQPKVKNSDAIK